jgi:hypothetical protein
MAEIVRKATVLVTVETGPAATVLRVVSTMTGRRKEVSATDPGRKATDRSSVPKVTDRPSDRRVIVRRVTGRRFDRRGTVHLTADHLAAMVRPGALTTTVRVVSNPVVTRVEDPMALRAPGAETVPAVVENGKTVDLVQAAIPDRRAVTVVRDRLVVVDVLLSGTRTVRPTVRFASARNRA